jgi:cytochrome bd ubiquinol oxidase subunit II
MTVLDDATLPFVLALVVLVALVIYALSAGADYGGGIWDLLASGPRARRQREAIEAAIAPIWEANHVWLILVVVVLFTAFPSAFGALMTALNLPLTAVLLGVVLRGSAFAFRKYDRPDDRIHTRWSTVFGVASFLTPFLLGLSVGAVASGRIRVLNGQVVTGFFAGWTAPFAVACGLFAQGLFAFLAAVYLTVDTAGDADVQADFRRRALFSGVMLAPAAALVLVLAWSGAPLLASRLSATWALPLVATTALAGATALVSVWRRRFLVARAAAIVEVTLILVGWGIAQYPYVIVPDLTFAASATLASTLRMLVAALVVGGVLLLPSFVYLFVVFKRQADVPSDRAH